MTYAKRILSILLVLCMLCNMAITVFASDTDSGGEASSPVDTFADEPALEDPPPDQGEEPPDGLTDENKEPSQEETAQLETNEEDTENPTEAEETSPSSETVEESSAQEEYIATEESVEESSEPAFEDASTEESSEPVCEDTSAEESTEPATEADPVEEPENPEAQITADNGRAETKASGVSIVHCGNVINTNGTLTISYYNYLEGANKTAYIQANEEKRINGAVAYCIQPEVYSGGSNYTKDEQMAAWSKMPRAMREAITLVMAYGYPHVSYSASADDIYWYGNQNMLNGENYFATQLLIWEFMAGVRNSVTFELTGSTSYRNACDSGWNSIRTTYDAILTKLKNHNAIPAYASRSQTAYVYELKYDSSTGTYRYLLPTERQSDWRNCRMTLPDGITYLKKSDNMTVIGFEATVAAAEALPKDGYTVSGESPYVSVDPDKAVACWTCDNSQAVATMVQKPDPAKAYFTLKKAASAVLEIVKTSPNGNVANIEFYIKDSSGKEVGRDKTDSGGKLKFENLVIGQTYTVTEVVKDGWICENNNQKITIQAGTNTLTFVNKRLDLKLIKESPDGNTKNITFKVYQGNANYQNGTVWKTVSTGIDGSFTIQGIPAGDYWFREVPLDGYAVQPDQKVTVTTKNTYDNPAVVTFVNEPLSSLKIVKQSPDGNVEGITFNVYKGFYTVNIELIPYATVTTDAEGTILLDALEPDTYYIREIVPEGYEPQAVQSVVVASENTPDNPAIVTFVNVPRPALKIVKESPDGHVEGISFNIYDSLRNYHAGNVLMTVTTTEDGTIQINNLSSSSTYYIEEIVPEGYAPQNVQKIRLTSENTPSNPAIVTFVNVPLSSLKIVKQSPDGKVKDITFNVYQGDANYQNKKIMQTVVSGTDGTIQIDKLTAGVYWIEEIVSDDYEEQEPQRVEVTTANTKDNPAIVTFVNVPLSSLKIIKESEDGNVENITFNIYAGEENYKNGTIFKTVVTGKDGTIQIDKLTAGVYWVQEIVPQGYTKQSDQKVTVTTANTKDNPVVVQFDNWLQRGIISIEKANTSGVALEGATFLLEYSTDNGATWDTVKPTTEDENGIGTCSTVEEDGTLTTGEDGQVVFDGLIVYGVIYRLTETVAPPGYQLLADPVFTGEIVADDNGVYEIYRTVVNVPTLQMPPTGGNGSVRWICAIATVVASASLLGLGILLKRRKAPESNG